MKPRILIVEDEVALLEMLKYNVEAAGFDVVGTEDGDEALLLVEETQPDLAILDWMLPGTSGLEICRRLRRNPKTISMPVIMVTARGEEEDRIRGLDSGADDYITKPFSPAELVARIRAVLRRSKPSVSTDVLTYSDVTMDLVTHRVQRSADDIHLGPTEFRLLKYLIEHPGRVFSREQILDAVWGTDIYVETRTVDVHIRRLRKALNEGGKQDLIRTVRSAGYSLDARS